MIPANPNLAITDLQHLNEKLLAHKRDYTLRRGLPILVTKGENAVRQDIYERPDESIRRNLLSAYADVLYDVEGYHAVLKYVTQALMEANPTDVLELGMGTGRLMYGLAEFFPHTPFIGTDYSYNMIRQAADLLLDGIDIPLDASERGFPLATLRGRRYKNVTLAQVDAHELPFESGAFDTVVSSFLLDRLHTPDMALREIHRVLADEGTCILITPLNFQRAEHWATYGSVEKLGFALGEVGLTPSIIAEITVTDALDIYGNKVVWQAVGYVCKKLDPNKVVEEDEDDEESTYTSKFSIRNYIIEGGI